jgi:biotin carboxyl carrier protein
VHTSLGYRRLPAALATAERRPPRAAGRKAHPPQTQKGQMPTLKAYQIEVNGQTYTVEIDDPNASPVHVIVNGRPFEVTISQRIEADRLHPADKLRPRDKPTDGAHPRGSDQDLLLETYVPAVASTYVEVAPEPEPVSTQEPTTEPSSTLRQQEGTETVTAPMPGTILDIAVKVGAVVQHGDVLCNLEAMKMKSPIRSPRAGTLVDILISEGQNVGYGDVLFTVG